MLYVHNLEIVTEDNVTVYKVRNVKATVALSEALQIVKLKDSGENSKSIIKDFLRRLDQELEEYLRL